MNFNLLTTDDTFSSDFGHTISVGAICFEDRFCTSKKGGIGGGGRAYSRHAVHMAAALAGCERALVSTGLIVSHFVSTNRYVETTPLPLQKQRHHFWNCRQF